MIIQSFILYKLLRTLGRLEDTHIWDLAQRVDSKTKVLSLGKNVLQLEDHVIQSALSGNKHALAAWEVLKPWTKNQGTPDKAYRSLYSALLDNSWRKLAEKLRDWDEKGEEGKKKRLDRSFHEKIIKNEFNFVL